MLTMGGQCLDGGIGELLPSKTSVAVGHVGPHRQRGIQQQDTLLSPARQVAALRYWRAQVGLYLLENVLKRRREGYAILHREAQAVGLAWFVIGILTDDDYLYLVERAKVIGVENQLSWRIANRLLVFLPDGSRQLRKVGLVELTL